MKRWFLLLIVFLFGFKDLNSQGFDWEFSPRLPFSIPKFYLGINGNSSKNFYNGGLTLIENFYSCGKFTKGSGNANSFGIQAEYWYRPNIAFNGSLQFQTASASFITEGTPFPVLIKGVPTNVVLENNLSMAYSYLLLNFGAKYRILSSFFFIGGNFEFGLKLSSNYNLYEQIKSPPEYHFNDNTQRRRILNGKLATLSLVTFNPKISIGYDATIFPGIYASPSISIQVPVFDISSEETLKLLSLQISVSFLRGLW